MHYTYLSQRFPLLVPLLLCFLASLAPCPGAAQTTRQYTSQAILALDTTTSATGHNPATQATLSPSLLLGAAALRLGFSSLNPPGSTAGLVVNSGDLLTLAALNGLVINTYLAPATTPQQTIQRSHLLTLQVTNSGLLAAEFTATKPFDQIELATGVLLSAYSIGLIEAYTDRTTPLPVSCGVSG